MKRSINNQLYTQINYAVILHNIIYYPLFTWRHIFGPLYPSLAVFLSFFAGCLYSLVVLILTEISVIKALLIFKWSWIVGIDEQFAGTFSILLNVGYVLVSQSARFVHNLKRFWNYFSFDSIFRYLLGSFHGTLDFQLLSGLYLGRQKNWYATIFLTITFSISTSSFILVFVKKIKERYKEKILLQQINIQIPDASAQNHFNNVQNNVAILSGIEMTMIVG